MGVEGNNLQLKLLILISLSALKCVCTQKCLPERFLPLPQTTECYRPLDTTTECVPTHYTCSSKPDAITWKVLSVISGRVDVTFLLPLSSACNETRFEVELKTTDKVDINDEETCAGARDVDFRLTHTKLRKLVVENECSNAEGCVTSCDKSGVVSFQFVFTGCYQIAIRPLFGTHSRQLIYSCPQYILTNYSKELLWDIVPVFALGYHDVRRNLPVTISFAPLTCNHLDLVIKLIANVSHQALGEACSTTGRVHSACPLGPNRTANCDNSSTEVIPDCSIDQYRVTCVFTNMSPGNYCIKMEIQDDRCDGDTLWTSQRNGSGGTSFCMWHHTYEALAGSADNSTKFGASVNSTKSYITIGSILFIATILSAIAVCFSCKIFAKRRSTKADLDSLQCPTPIEPCRILLLYARDCPPFMNLMATFRQLLEDSASCEVYDCFDGSRWPELSRNPVEWTRHLVTQRDTKIILVATKCSSLRQKAHLENNIIRYNDASCNDDLFLYALQMITDSAVSDVYKRIFVVRFEGVADDSDLFAHLNSYTRFVLPLHLDKLIYSLNESAFSDQSVQLKESEVQSVCQDLTHLISYIKQHDNYLQNMLTFQRSS